MAKILIGVTGGIAAYKVASVVSVLDSTGHDVKVIMTEAAKQFITPLTFSSLSHNEVYGDHNRFANDGHIHHIELSEWCDLMAIVPATANTINKIFFGLADNLLMSTVMALNSSKPYHEYVKPLLIFPAMNTNMWSNVYPHIQNMYKRYTIIDPVKGKMACGTVGKGKLPPTRTIIEEIERVLSHE